MIRFTGYRVIAEKPRDSHLPQIFPCTMYENYALDRKTIDTFLNGLDVLYHRAKFVEDRTTCDGSMFDNMLFIFFYLSRSDPVGSGFDGVHSSKDRVAVYGSILMRFSIFFSEGTALSEVLHSSHFSR